MDAELLVTMRPRDGSAAAIRAALAVVAREREGAASRRDIALENRKSALRDPAATAKDVVVFEGHTRDAEVEVERCEVLAEDLNTKLAEALQREDAEAKCAAVEDARVAYVEAVETLRARLAEYDAAAAVIVRICAAERASVAALAQFRVAVGRSLAPGSQAHSHLFDPGIVGLDGSFLGDVVLPGLPGKPMIMGPSPSRLVPRHYLQNNPPGPYG